MPAALAPTNLPQLFQVEVGDLSPPPTSAVSLAVRYALSYSQLFRTAAAQGMQVSAAVITPAIGSERMSGGGQIIATGFCHERESGRLVIQLVTEARCERCAVYMLPDAPVPPVGTTILWTAWHVGWTGPGGAEVAVRKIGYAFDPNTALA